MPGRPLAGSKRTPKALQPGTRAHSQCYLTYHLTEPGALSVDMGVIVHAMVISQPRQVATHSGSFSMS